MVIRDSILLINTIESTRLFKIIIWTKMDHGNTTFSQSMMIMWPFARQSFQIDISTLTNKNLKIIIRNKMIHTIFRWS